MIKNTFKKVWNFNYLMVPLVSCSLGLLIIISPYFRILKSEDGQVIKPSISGWLAGGFLLFVGLSTKYFNRKKH